MDSQNWTDDEKFEFRDLCRQFAKRRDSDQRAIVETLMNNQRFPKPEHEKDLNKDLQAAYDTVTTHGRSIDEVLKRAFERN